MSSVSVLGQECVVIFDSEPENNPKMEGANGYMEPYSKKIVVQKQRPHPMNVENIEDFEKKVLRHEIVHAFMQESGLRECSWGDNEEIVDWIALQGLKIYQAWKEAGAV